MGMTKKELEKVYPSCRDSVGICSENGFHYFASVGFPQDIECGLCVTHIGRVAVTYRVGVFVAEKEKKSSEKKKSNFSYNTGGTIVIPSMTSKNAKNEGEDEEENEIDVSDVDDGSIKAIGQFVHVF